MGKAKIFKKLRKAAKKLPPAFVPVKVKRTGKELLEFNKDAKDKDGNPVEPKKIYNVTEQRQVNHYRELKNLSKGFGVEVAAQYFKAVLDKKGANNPIH